jgi:hypothetical protein
VAFFGLGVIELSLVYRVIVQHCEVAGCTAAAAMLVKLSGASMLHGDKGCCPEVMLARDFVGALLQDGREAIGDGGAASSGGAFEMRRPWRWRRRSRL